MGKGVQAGAAEVDVTPPLGVRMAGGFQPVYAEGVHDPLYARAVVLDNEETRVAFVMVDVIGLSLDDVQKVREDVARHVDIPPDHLMIGCTHTHSGPATQSIHEVDKEEAYVEWLLTRISDAVRLAVRRLRPARVGTGRGEQHHIGFCRRYRMKDGTVRMNPGKGNPDIVEPTSPIDPTVGVLYVEGEEGNPLAVVTQFGMHYVGTDGRGEISADYYGHFANTMRALLGQGCTPLLLNGALGQVNNVNPFDTHNDRGHARGRRMAGMLAGEVLKVIGRIRPQETCFLQGITYDIELPRQEVTDQDLDIARQILAGGNPSPDAGPFSYVVGQPIPERLRPVYARHLLRLADMPKALATQVHVLRTGEAAWVGLPGQTFTEIGLEIIERSPMPQTFIINLANDNVGYIATDKARLEEGGYETWSAPSSPVGAGAERIIVETALELLGRVKPGASSSAAS